MEISLLTAIFLVTAVSLSVMFLTILFDGAVALLRRRKVRRDAQRRNQAHRIK